MAGKGESMIDFSTAEDPEVLSDARYLEEGLAIAESGSLPHLEPGHAMQHH